MKSPLSIFRKKNLLVIGACLSVITIPPSSAHQLEWQSIVWSNIVDSEGNVLNPDNFVFELGSFSTGFNPSESNVNDWIANWRAFDSAVYNAVDGHFTSSVDPYNGGADVFEGLGIERTAFIWIRNSDTPEPGTEWLVLRADNWVFPDLVTGCCDNEETIQWSTSDLTDVNVPLWGGHSSPDFIGAVTGSGVYSNLVDSIRPGGDPVLQTFTFIPEPSSALLIAFTGVMAALRRNRDPKVV